MARRVETPFARTAVSAEGVAVFRCCFGAVAAFAAARFLAKGWVEQLYLTPQAHLRYPGLGWV